MPILGIDPGITTGYCLVTQYGDILESGNLLEEDLEESILVKYAQDDSIKVVIEKVPVPTQGEMNLKLERVLEWIKKTFPNAIWVLPGTWKNDILVINYKAPNDWEGEPTQHQKDSFRIALWCLLKLKRESNEA